MKEACSGGAALHVDYGINFDKNMTSYDNGLEHQERETDSKGI